MNTWTISDTHFNHTRIIEYCYRPFSSVDEMNDTMIRNWNAVVQPEDTVYHLGDFALGSLGALSRLRARLAGRIILILGNHDRSVASMLRAGMDEVHKNLTITHGGVSIYMSHRPCFDYRHADLHLYGHVHNKTPPTQPLWARNVSVEMTNYAPVSLNAVTEILLTRV